MGQAVTRPWQGKVSGQALRLVLGLALGLLAGAFALRGTDLGKVWILLSRAALGPMALSLLLVAVTQLVKALRWQVILGGRETLPLMQALHGLLVGQALNLLVPARAGDFTRAYLVGRRLTVGSIFTFYTVVIEKAWEVLMLLACLAVLLFWGPWPAWLSRSGILVGVLTVIAVAVSLVGASVWHHRRGQETLGGGSPLDWLTHRLLRPAAELAEDLVAAGHDGRLLRMGLWSAAVWTLGTATNWAVFAALGLSVHWSAALLIIVAIYAGVAIPAPPGRVGLFHYLVVLSLSGYGVGQSEALACGVLLHLVVVMPLLLAGGVAAWVKE
ncbi:MAG: lysylphosphatidylglycerol synthase transmembrane domain-containing protein [Anaerolineae bacterium]